MKKCATTSPAALLIASGLPVRRAFTVVELLVAIGAVAIVTIGLAAIFDAVGKTVQGGKRASALSQYATMVENQLRQDLASIDPNSFMVIRQQFVDGGNQKIDLDNPEGEDLVPLYRDQPPTQWRLRRIDELMFFARGDFASVRTPIVPDVVARSREARVYYGHGQKMTPSLQGSPTYDDYTKPEGKFRAPANSINAVMPQLGLGAATNRYASEWTLLRHVTVLQQPAATFEDVPDLQAIGVSPGAVPLPNIVDKDAQIALQPAAPTIFRTTLFPRLPAAGIGDCVWASTDALNGDLHPSFATGMVDVATMDVSEIRTWILGTSVTPNEWTQNLSNTNIDYKELQFTPFGGTPGSLPNLPSLDRMHLWMGDAMPTQSLSRAPLSLGGGTSFETSPDLDPIGRRIRYEAQPQDLRQSLESSALAPTGGYATRALQDAYERSAQVMLSAHNFVPRCSNFIVEWSFGRSDPSVGLIWHGPPVASNVSFYPYQLSATEFVEEGRDYTFTYIDRSPEPDVQRVESRMHMFKDTLIYGESPDRRRTDVPSAVTSYFGYIDPTFDPRSPLAGQTGFSNDELQGVAGNNDLMEWPRPKLIRVTMTLADPQNPALEETFQFVLEVPQPRSK